MTESREKKLKYLFRIGQGGMADVFLALWRGPAGTAKLVVVKQLLDENADKDVFRQMFLEEARIAARMNHPNVVQTYEVAEEDGEVSLTMEYLEGQSLNRLMRELSRRERSVRPEVLVRIVSDALAGLHYAHELRDFDGSALGIVHRDVSPHNLFVTYDGQVKVVDFGIAKTEVSPVKTATGVLKGKAAYMAPEQLSGDPVDRRADIFTAGTILWELLSMRRLMAAGTQVKTILRVLQEPVPRLAAYVPGIDRKLEAIVARALERDPNRRFHTARAMREALEEWLATAPPVRPEHVGELVAELFGDIRAHTDMQIRERISRVRMDSGARIRAPHMSERSDAEGRAPGAKTSDRPTELASPRAMRRAVLPEVRARSSPTLRRMVLTLGVLAGLAFARHVASTPMQATAEHAAGPTPASTTPSPITGAVTTGRHEEAQLTVLPKVRRSRTR